MSDSVSGAVVGVVFAMVVAAVAAGSAVPVRSQAGGTASPAPPGAVAQENGVRVGVQNLSAESVTLRNVTATDVVARELTVRQMGQRRNVTVENVSLPRIAVERAELSEVRVEDAVIRSRDLISAFGIPYARGLNVTNQSVQRVGIRNRTVDGVVVESVTVESSADLNLTTPEEFTDDARVNISSPEVRVGNASVSEVRSFQVSLADGTTNGTAAGN